MFLCASVLHHWCFINGVSSAVLYQRYFINGALSSVLFDHAELPDTAFEDLRVRDQMRARASGPFTFLSRPCALNPRGTRAFWALFALVCPEARGDASISGSFCAPLSRGIGQHALGNRLSAAARRPWKRPSSLVLAEELVRLDESVVISLDAGNA